MKIQSGTLGRFGTFSTKAFKIAVGLVCAGLAISAIYNYIQLNRLRLEYLRHHAVEIANTIDSQMRGPNRADPGNWQGLLMESIAGREDSVAILGLIDETGNVLAKAVQRDDFSSALTGPTGSVKAQGTALFIYDSPLQMAGLGGGAAGMGGGSGMVRGPGFGRRNLTRRLRVGLFSSEADFIFWQAAAQLVMNGIAIMALIGLAYYFLRTLSRFLQLKAKEVSERHLTALGSMAATLAHEIRNPLGAMKGLTQLAQEDLARDHTTQALLSTVVREAERLEQLVADLLAFAGPRDPQIGPFDLHKLIADLKFALQPKLDAARIQLDMESCAPDLMLSSDENGIRQVLLNVLLNAIDSTPSEGTIAIRTRIDAPNRLVIVEVDDSGPGLGGRDPEELFQPFTTTKAKGTGLGLSISRQIMERLGGRIELATRREGGARCTLAIKA